MGLSTHGSTMPGAVTPICNDCGTFLCWDLSNEEADQARDFWEAWICEDCNGGVRMSLKQWRAQQAARGDQVRDQVEEELAGAAGEQAA